MGYKFLWYSVPCLKMSLSLLMSKLGWGCRIGQVFFPLGAQTFSQEKGEHGGRSGSASQCPTIMSD